MKAGALSVVAAPLMVAAGTILALAVSATFKSTKGGRVAASQKIQSRFANLLALIAARFEHGYFIHVQCAVCHRTGYADVMSFMAFERILIVDIQHTLVFLGNKDQF